jgi:hypothetical protein
MFFPSIETVQDPVDVDRGYRKPNGSICAEATAEGLSTRRNANLCNLEVVERLSSTSEVSKELLSMVKPAHAFDQHAPVTSTLAYVPCFVSCRGPQSQNDLHRRSDKQSANLTRRPLVR